MRSRRECGRWAVRVLGPEGEESLPGVGRAESRARIGPRQLPGRSGLRWLGKAETRCLPATNGDGAKARVSDAWVR